LASEPPIVPMDRTAGSPMPSASFASAGICVRISAFAATSAWRVAAPTVMVPSIERDAVQLRDAAHIDQVAGRCKVLLHRGQERLPPGEDLRPSLARSATASETEAGL
jgi:hypothetical protein